MDPECRFTLAYVDDLGSAGNSNTANTTIQNCSIMEEEKKMTINRNKKKMRNFFQKAAKQQML